MKKRTVDFGNFAKEAMTLTEMNFLRGGGDPDLRNDDLIVPPDEDKP